MSVFDLPIEKLSGVGPKTAALFKKMGVDTIGALLEFYPRQYEDWSVCYTTSNAPLGQVCCVKATVAAPVQQYRVRKGMTLYKCNATDGSTTMRITIFNNRFAAEKLKTGQEYLFFGKVGGNFHVKEMSSPQIEQALSPVMRPIYRQTQGLHSRLIEKMIRQALKLVGDTLEDPLREQIRTEYGLCHYRFALERIHFPTSQQDIAVARKRLIFEELLVLALGMQQIRGRNQTQSSAVIRQDSSQAFIEGLPFTMTGAQKRAVAEAVADMCSGKPMNRLLQGDVGSGKTAVAAALMDVCAKNGLQSAMMAPTEILASQHYTTLSKLMAGSGNRIMLLTGSTPAVQKQRILRMLQEGEIDIVVGTHALIQQSVSFSRLGLVITDEQHRFGVAQRAALSKKGENPHLYVMSATPIPRTLALMIYGDLDVSVLDELPKGRQKIETYAVSSQLRQRAYNYIQKHLDAGRQGYIVCPLIEENESDLASVEEYYKTLATGRFKGYQVGLLNGRMKAAEKELVMKAFVQGEIQLLVTTTVIEVGVDVPNAVIMLIENAERFGLSQLHQLRGRIGRGQYKSTCILLSDAQGETAKKRLEIMCKSSDGFYIANEDLKLRGPGDFFGARQHGLPELKIANILEDMQVLQAAQKLAGIIIKKDPQLRQPEHAGLQRQVRRLFSRAQQTEFN